MNYVRLLGALLLVGCAPGARILHSHQYPVGQVAMVEPEIRPSDNPYAGLFCYYGDMHFHSGYSSDNRNDGPPLKAWQSAVTRSSQIDSRAKPWLGGYFLFVTDHVSYIRTRQDMDEGRFQAMRQQADDALVDIKGPDYTFTAFPGAELTGLRRGGDYPHFDDKFGHLNFFNMDSIEAYTETDIIYNHEGEAVMDHFAQNPQHLAQFNHPGYGEEPRTGTDALHLYPYTPERARVFRLIEVNNDVPANWVKGVSQYNLCLRRGFHVSPVVGTDIHNTAAGLTGQARTVIWAPSTLGMEVQQRRKILLEGLRWGRVYASENQTLMLQWSLDGYPMGATIARRLKAVVKVEAKCITGNIVAMELVGDRKPDVDEEHIEDERQCTRVLASWKMDSKTFTGQQSIKLNNTHYVYMRLLLDSGERAVSSPIYLESKAPENKP